MNCISFSLFGYGKTQKNGFNFATYIRGLSFNIKMAELIYPNWKIHLSIDEESYLHFSQYFDYHINGGKLDVNIIPYSQICKMMLYRMYPIFTGKYQRVLCRDLDSITSYREAQAVNNWINNGRCVHAITDSVSHNISLMGGMIAFESEGFKRMTKLNSFEDFLNLKPNFDFNHKGSDQEFLNRYLLPLIDTSIVEHYVLGMKQSFRGACYNFIQDDELPLDSRMRESNRLTEHIGAAGFHTDATLLWFSEVQTEEQKKYYKIIEDEYKEIHYWRYENI